MIRSILSAVIASGLLLFPYSAIAATIHVPADQPNIQAGINAAFDGDLVLVSPGTYVENIDFLGKAIMVQSEQGDSLTIIDGNNNGSVVTFANDEPEDAVLDGFTIKNGTGTYHDIFSFGGGIYCWDASFTIINCTIKENYADTGGGGIFCSSYSSPIIQNCTISENDADLGAGGIECISSFLSIINCKISKNSKIAINSSSSSSLYIESSEITENGDSGGILCSYCSLEVVHCTIARNRSILEGAGISCSGSYSCTVVNSILWDNLPDQISGLADVSFSDVMGFYPGEGNIWEDPLFIDPENGNYHLAGGSPCIDSGTDAGVYTDIDGDIRPLGAGFDMGADEFVPSGPCLAQIVPFKSLPIAIYLIPVLTLVFIGRRLFRQR